MSDVQVMYCIAALKQEGAEGQLEMVARKASNAKASTQEPLRRTSCEKSNTCILLVPWFPQCENGQSTHTEEVTARLAGPVDVHGKCCGHVVVRGR
eukprot:1152720-Pelagomonas_calceolata.AAC.2